MYIEWSYKHRSDLVYTLGFHVNFCCS